MAATTHLTAIIEKKFADPANKAIRLRIFFGRRRRLETAGTRL